MNPCDAVSPVRRGDERRELGVRLGVRHLEAREHLAALDRLLAAGITQARLEDVVSGGRTLWRLRVPAAGDPAEHAVRIAGLGFGTPQPERA